MDSTQMVQQMWRLRGEYVSAVQGKERRPVKQEYKTKERSRACIEKLPTRLHIPRAVGSHHGVLSRGWYDLIYTFKRSLWLRSEGCFMWVICGNREASYVEIWSSTTSGCLDKSGPWGDGKKFWEREKHIWQSNWQALMGRRRVEGEKRRNQAYPLCFRPRQHGTWWCPSLNLEASQDVPILTGS